MARADVDAPPHEAETGPQGRGGVQARREARPPPAGLAIRHVPDGQEVVRGELRHGARDGVLGVGDRGMAAA